MTPWRSVYVSALTLSIAFVARTGHAQEPAAHPAGEAHSAPGPAHPDMHVGAESHNATEGEAQEGHEHGEHEESEEHRGYVGLDAVFGFGKWTGEGANKTGVYSFVLGGHYEVAPGFALGARLPLTHAVAKISSDTNSDATTFGNLELAAEYEMHPTTNHEFAVPLELGIALPTAGGDEFSDNKTLDSNSPRLRSLVNSAAASSRGGEENALFASHRLGIVPRIGFDYEAGALDLTGYTKLEILVKSGGGTPPAEEGTLNKTAVEWVTGVGGFYRVVPHMLSIGTRAWVGYAAKREIDLPSDVITSSRTQFVLEPGIRGTFGAFRPSVSYIVPLGGGLSDAGFGGVRVVAGGVF